MAPSRPLAFVLLSLVTLLLLVSRDVAFCQPETTVAVADDTATEQALLEGSAALADDFETEDAPLTTHERGAQGENLEDEDEGSNELLDRPVDERPRTTKRLYTTRPSARANLERRGRFLGGYELVTAAVGMLLLFAFLLNRKGPASEFDEENAGQPKQNERTR